jgi:hypothetical protein
MRNLFIILFALYSSFAFGLPSEEDLKTIKLPLIHVVTVDSVDPSFEVVSPPEGCFGSSITNNEYEKGRIYITLGDSLIMTAAIFSKTQQVAKSGSAETEALLKSDLPTKSSWKKKLIYSPEKR